MPNVSLTSYDAQLADAQRRQKMAEMLQEQANAPFDIQSYKGVQAPIPWTGVLAKALQGFGGAYLNSKADEQKAAASKQDLASALELANASSSKMPNIQTSMPVRTEEVQQPMAQPVGLQSMAPPVGATNGMVESKEHKLAAALAAQDAAQNPVPAAAPIVQAAPPMAAPQPDFRQELLSRMQANPGNYDQGLTQADFDKAKMAQPAAAPSPLAGAMGPQSLPQSLPKTISIPDASLYPQSTERTPENKAQIALQGALGGGGPKTAALGSMLYQNAQTQLDEQRKLDLARKEKGLDREEDVNRALSVVNSIPGLTPDQRELLRFSGKALGTKGIESSLDQMAKNQFGEHYTTASPEQLEGYPKGTTGQISTTTGKLVNVYNPTSDLNSIAQVKISQASLGIQQAGLGLRQQEFGLSQAKFDADQAAKEHAIIDPATISQLALQARAGDTSVFQNLGRGNQGAQNIVNLRRAIFDPALPPLTGTQMAQMNANFKGATAEQQAVGRRIGNASVGAEEVPNMAKLSDDAYRKLPRGQFVPFNKLRQLVETNTASPEQAVAYAADSSVVQAYARAISPTGVGTDAVRDRGYQMLNTAMGPEAHRRVLNQLIMETNAIKAGAKAAAGTGQKPAELIKDAPVHKPYADPAKEKRYQDWYKANH